MIELSGLENIKKKIAVSKIPIIIFLHAPWCGNCRSMYSVVEELDKQYSGKVMFIKINASDDKESAEFFQVQGIPKFVSVKKGKVIDSFSGANSTRLETMVKSL